MAKTSTNKAVSEALTVTIPRLKEEVERLREETKQLKLEKEAVIHNKITAMALAMEFGYKECEKGHNIDLAYINFNNTINQKR